MENDLNRNVIKNQQVRMPSKFIAVRAERNSRVDQFKIYESEKFQRREDQK